MPSLQALSLWLHVVAVAGWVGGMCFFLIVFAPAVHSLPPAAAVPVLDRGRRRLEALAWIAAGLLLITGIANFVLRVSAASAAMIAPYYWTLGVKVFLFIAMTFHHFLQAFKYGPRIVAHTSEIAGNPQAWPEPLLSYWKKWFVLLKINAGIGLALILFGMALTRM